ncbi:MAG: ABC transporter ATP-binding protein [Magnetospiraceae bacterium]
MLEIKNLQRLGLSPVSLKLDAGECIAVRGNSGSGKSVFMRAVADLDPSEGRVLLNGVDRNDMPAPKWRRQVAYVPAESGWWAETVEAHFTEWDTARVMARRLGLDSQCGEWPITRLSTGERQRLALVRALNHAPKVLLLDEPTSGLDKTTTAAVEALVHERRADGAAVIWVTHDDGQVTRVAKRVLRVANGVLTEESA